MTPKEKAIQLIYAFEAFVDRYDEYELAKQCAAITVDEIIKFGNQAGIREPMMYWNKVQEEIENL
jgi:hypothetical protein